MDRSCSPNWLAPVHHPTIVGLHIHESSERLYTALLLRTHKPTNRQDDFRNIVRSSRGSQSSHNAEPRSAWGTRAIGRLYGCFSQNLAPSLGYRVQSNCSEFGTRLCAPQTERKRQGANITRPIIRRSKSGSTGGAIRAGEWDRFASIKPVRFLNQSCFVARVRKK